jgi:hypothetical protein
MPQAVPGAIPAKRKTSPIVWILSVVLGIFVLGFVGIVGTGLFVFHKARQAGLDPDLMKRNPAAAVARMMVAANKDVDLVSEDDTAGTITVRDRKTGKVVTMNFNDAKNGRFSFSAEGDDGKTATMQFGGGAEKLPSWIPAYPGSKPQVAFSAKGDSAGDAGEGGTFTFTTPDSPSKVIAFYQDKAREMGMKVNMTTTTNEGGIVSASDEGNKRSLTITVGTESGGTNVGVLYGEKK